MYVCICHGVNDKQIKQAVSQGAQSMRDLAKTLCVGTKCGKCVCQAREYLPSADAKRSVA
ncbi:(2Fe-2S)-binding protein [Salinibius halmophilus]|uniref:(2Fe-2S)-binding protein n=1 Tax=Salinibius halmophilus TaxID=1853216 RepID=UPI000E66737E|nr:(2Fe-2S)-binding protein [Salinibius halmophilus]